MYINMHKDRRREEANGGRRERGEGSGVYMCEEWGDIGKIRHLQREDIYFIISQQK